MDDVKIHECFPTLVHEFKFEQAIAEQEQMINYVKDLDNKGGYKRNYILFNGNGIDVNFTRSDSIRRTNYAISFHHLYDTCSAVVAYP